MALTQPQSELLAGYIGRSQALHTQLIGRARNYWSNLGYLTDREVELLIERMGWLSTAANTRMSTLTEAYLTRYAAISGGELAAGSATDISTMALRGISEAELFDRVPKTVFGALARKDPFTKAKDLGWNRLESLLATSLQLSKTHTSQDVLDREPRTPRGQRIVGYRRVTAGYNACALCLVASTQRYRRGDLMPIHPGCVLEGSRVSAEGVSGISRRLYQGEIIVISVTDGDDLRVTPNHPVLTDHGWVPAGMIREGDRIVRSGREHRVVDGRPNEQQVPPLIEDVWGAASVAGFVSVPVAPEDFHGDGADGEVDIVRTDWGLAPVGAVSFIEPALELGFMLGWLWDMLASPAGVPAFLGPIDPLASHGRVGGSNLSLPFLERHLPHAHVAGGGSPSDGDVVFFEDPTYLPAAHVVGARQFEFTGSGFVGLDDVDVWELSPLASTKLDAPTVEFDGEGLLVHADRGRGVLDRLTGEVQLDTVVESRRVYASSCHVYNLETSSGWYSSNNHIVSNCRCTVAPIIGDKDPGLVLDRETLDQVHARMRETFGGKSEGARRFTTAEGELMSYRDAILTRTNSEIGPVLTVKKHKFYQPLDRE